MIMLGKQSVLIWIIVVQGPTVLVVGAGGGCFDICLALLTLL